MKLPNTGSHLLAHYQIMPYAAAWSILEAHRQDALNCYAEQTHIAQLYDYKVAAVCVENSKSFMVKRHDGKVIDLRKQMGADAFANIPKVKLLDAENVLPFAKSYSYSTESAEGWEPSPFNISPYYDRTYQKIVYFVSVLDADAWIDYIRATFPNAKFPEALMNASELPHGVVKVIPEYRSFKLAEAAYLTAVEKATNQLQEGVAKTAPAIIEAGQMIGDAIATGLREAGQHIKREIDKGKK